MKHKLHIASRMFLTNPYVVRVNHPESVSHENQNLGEFRRLLRTAKLMIRDTWGYSNPVFEIIKSEYEPGVTVNGVQTTQWFTPLTECHSYWVFTNDMDALQFRLTVGENALQMHMWPNNIKYTIYEYIKDTDCV